MKKVMSKHHDAVVTFLKLNPNSTFDTIKEGNPKISDIMLRKVVKDLQDEGVIASNDEDGGYVLTGAPDKPDTQLKIEPKDNKQPLSTVGAKAVVPVEKKKKEEEELGPKTPSGRDFSKYSFNGVSGLSKGKVVLAICKQYVKDNPKTTLAKMQEVFKGINARYGVVAEIGLARKTTVNKTERYFFKEADIIKISNQKAVVTNQWSLATLTPFLKIAKELGYKTTISK